MFAAGGTVCTFAPAASHALVTSSDAAAVVITSVGASEVSKSGPSAGTRPCGVEHDAQRLAFDRLARVAGGEARQVGERGPGSDDHRLGVGAQLVHVGAGRRSGDPAR